MQAQGKTLSQRQRGAALIVSLIMLIMVSLLAAGGFLITTGEARSAANWSDRQRALFMAEDALIHAIQEVETFKNTNGVSKLNALGKTYFYQRGNFDATAGWPSKIKPGSGCLDYPTGSTLNCYVIVFDGFPPALATSATKAKADGARLTFYARAGGQRAGTFVVLSTSRAFN